MESESHVERVFNTDWTSVSESEKADMISKHVHLVEMSTRASNATSAYVANMRSLILMMFITLVCIIRSTDNRSVVLSIIGCQFIKTIFSRFFEVSLKTSTDIEKKNLFDLVKKKSEQNRDE